MPVRQQGIGQLVPAHMVNIELNTRAAKSSGELASKSSARYAAISSAVKRTLYDRSRLKRQHLRACLPDIQHVRPVLHHLGAIGKIICMVVSAPHRVGFRMGELPLDPVRGESHFVQSRAPGRACRVRTVFATPAQILERLPQRRHGQFEHGGHGGFGFRRTGRSSSVPRSAHPGHGRVSPA